MEESYVEWIGWGVIKKKQTKKGRKLWRRNTLMSKVSFLLCLEVCLKGTSKLTCKVVLSAPAVFCSESVTVCDWAEGEFCK